MHRCTIHALLLVLPLAVSGQQPATAPNAPTKKTPIMETSAATEPELDIQAIVKETEFVEFGKQKLGLFWWVPPDYWERALRQQGYNSEQMLKNFAPFKRYNVFLIAAGNMQPPDFLWSSEEEIKQHVVLRDQQGNLYKPFDQTPEDLRTLTELMKPVFKNMMGNFGGGLQFVVFPLKDRLGNVFADAHKSSEVFLDVSNLMGHPVSTYTWRFPLTALNPPKYCPVGKEKVEASWKFCPWHGNKLINDAEPAAASAPEKH